MDGRERKARILFGQHLTAPGERRQVCRDLNGLQAQFLSHARHALRIRCAAPLPEPGWGDGLVKSWSVRGTMHLFDEADLPLFLHEGRDHFLRDVDGLGDDAFVTAVRKDYFARLIRERVGAGEGEREALKAACTRAGMTETEAQSLFDPWGGLLRALAERGELCYQVQERKAYRLCPPFTPLDRETAETELLHRYFSHFGPATLRDAAYWLGQPQRRIRALMEKLPLRAVEAEGQLCYTLGEAEDVPDLPHCLFLAGFDQLLLGYRKEDGLFLPAEHLRGIFTRAGIVRPAVLLWGRVAACWQLTRNRLSITAFEPLSAADRRRLAREAGRLWPELKGLTFA